MNTRSQDWFSRAQHVIPGGVNSPVRAFLSVGGTPRFIRKALGAKIWDEDDNAYLDFVGAWGPAIAGHAHPNIIEAVRLAALNGLAFGAPTALEVEMAECLCRLLPSIEMVRLVNSGTEATMSAIRVARGFTGRSIIIKFEGCYHGHADSLLVKAGSGMLTFGHPSSAGVPEDFIKHTLVLPYNDLEKVTQVFKQQGQHIAAVIVEPIAGNMNMIKPVAGFLQGLKDLCHHYGSVLIFDEVMTGFRVGPQGVQGLLNICPDMTTMGKVIGGGMPVGAFGGRRDIMQTVAPLGPVYQAGTLSGSPVSVAAGLASLKLIEQPAFYDTLKQMTAMLTNGLEQVAKKAGLPFCSDFEGGMFGLYFSETVPKTYADVLQCNQEHFKQFFHGMLEAGYYFAPSAFEAGFLSAAHRAEDITATISQAEQVFAKIMAKY